MGAAQSRLVGPVLGLVRNTERDRCFRGSADRMPNHVGSSPLEHLPGFHGSAGPMDAWFHAAAAASSSAADGTDRRQILAYRWLGADRLRWLAQFSATNPS